MNVESLELMAGVSNFVATIGPAVASGYLPMDVAKSLLLMAVRRFRAGPAIEGEIEKIQQPPQQPQPQDNTLQVEQMRAQTKLQRQQADIQGQMQIKSAELDHAKEIEAIWRLSGYSGLPAMRTWKSMNEIGRASCRERV